MSRLASPLLDDRSTKRPRKSLDQAGMAESPGRIADIVPTGNVILVVNGIKNSPGKLGLRVSSQVLSMASSVFGALLAVAGNKRPHNDGGAPRTTTMAMDDDDNGDAMFILLNILHLKNDKLPARMIPDLLCKVATLAVKYQCDVAAGRATLQWFDRLYASKESCDVWKIIEAAYLLDEPMFFARFTSRWVLEQSISTRSIPRATDSDTANLAGESHHLHQHDPLLTWFIVMLSDRHTQASTLLRTDLDALADQCIYSFSKQGKHYIDYASGLNPDPEEHDGKMPPECRVDGDCAIECLGALRDAEIWPSTVWDATNRKSGIVTSIGGIVEKLYLFREPEYDDVDKCEFCENVKIKFTEALDQLKDSQKDRLWGLCLDCYKTGGHNSGECRYEHAKSRPVDSRAPGEVQQGGIGITGL